MHVIVFEDGLVERLGVVVASRPACDLTIGTTTLVEMAGGIGKVCRAVRRPLAEHVAGCRTRGVTIWGRAPCDAHDAPPSDGSVLAVNARLAPTRRHLDVLRSLVAAGRRGRVSSEPGVAAALLLPTDADDRDVVQGLLDGSPEAAEALAALRMPEWERTLPLLVDPHDVVSEHERVIEDGLAERIDGGQYIERRPGLFVARTGQVHDLVAVRRGPVVVEDGAEIGPFVCLDGPVWVGPQARVHPRAWIRGGTSIGHACRIGGEVEATVFEPFANKAHDGFIGHSHVGSWANLAAGTISGNLKSTYGEIRLHDPRPDGSRATVHTGRQFLGAFVGELVRSAVGTLLPCGARIGTAATIGGTVPERVPSFFNMLVGGPDGSRSTAEQAATVLARMMKRRGIAAVPADLALLTALADGASDRHPSRS